MSNKSKVVGRKAGMSLSRAERFAKSVDKKPKSSSRFILPSIAVCAVAVAGFYALGPTFTAENSADVGANNSPSAQPQVEAAANVVDSPAVVVSDIQPVSSAAATRRPCPPELLTNLSNARIEFGPGDSTISADQGERMIEAARGLSNCRGLTVAILGHANAQLDGEMTRFLSWQRARMVLAMLQGAGLDVSNYRAQGIGMNGDLSPDAEVPVVTVAITQRP